jgi:hypothetical protein
LGLHRVNRGAGGGVVDVGDARQIGTRSS